MSEPASSPVVFSTTHYDEAATLCAMLAEAGIASDLLGDAEADAASGEEIRISVSAESERDAVALIEAYLQSIGAAPAEEQPAPAAEENLLPCPNCEKTGIALKRPCPGCGFAVRALACEPPLVKDFTPGARSFCPECRDPLTFPSGACPRCGEELEALEPGDRLCPERTAHVLYRDTVGGAVCQACRGVWLELADS